DGRRNDLPIIKLAGSTGERLWSQTITGPARLHTVGVSESAGGAVVIEPGGAIRAVGLVGRAVIDDGGPGPDLTPTSTDGTGRRGRLPPSVPSLILFAAQFSDRIAGRSLSVRASSEGAALRLVAVDPNILAPATGSLGDPTQHGGILTI